MKYKAILLAITILLNCMILSGCPNDSTIIENSGSSIGPTTIQSQNTTTTPYTTLGTPFNGDGNWYMTQAFGAYLHTTININGIEKDKINGYHTGEDWNYASKDGDKGKAIFPIAPGHVIDYGPVNPGDKDGLKSGFYLIVKHEGRFKIPSSDGAHLSAMREVMHEKDRASNGGASMIKAQDLYGYGVWKDYDLGENEIIEIDGKIVRNGNYSVKIDEITTIYSVYMHINNPDTFVDGLSNKDITPDMMDKQIGTLMPGMDTESGMSNFYSHLHFEIRVGSEESIKKSVIQGKEDQTGGYFHFSQDMVKLGYREPSSIIQANVGQGSITGSILGTETSSTTSEATTTIPTTSLTTTTQASTTALVNEKSDGYIYKVYKSDSKYFLEIDYVDLLSPYTERKALVTALKEDGLYNYKYSEEVNIEEYLELDYRRNRNKKIRTFEIAENATLLLEVYAYNEAFKKSVPITKNIDHIKVNLVEFMDFINNHQTYFEGEPFDSLFNVTIKDSKIIRAYDYYVP